MKRYTLLLALGMTCGLLAGCGGESKPADGDPGEKPGAPATVTPPAPAAPTPNLTKAKLTELKTKQAELQNQFDAYTKKLDSFGSPDALHRESQTLGKEIAFTFDEAAAKAKIAEYETKLAKWNMVYDGRQVIKHDLDEIQREIKKLEAE